MTTYQDKLSCQDNGCTWYQDGLCCYIRDTDGNWIRLGKNHECLEYDAHLDIEGNIIRL